MKQTYRLIAAGLLVAGCRHTPPPQTTPTPPLEVTASAPPAISLWPLTLADVQRAFEAGNYADADRLLAGHSARNAGTAEGAESDFWRAMLKADPANAEPTVRERMALFDGYLNAGPAAPRHVEATIFRRLIESLDSTRAAVVTLRAAAESRERARDDEVKRLSEDLDRTMAELERIKRRLAPKPPG